MSKRLSESQKLLILIISVAFLLVIGIAETIVIVKQYKEEHITSSITTDTYNEMVNKCNKYVSDNCVLIDVYYSKTCVLCVYKDDTEKLYKVIAYYDDKTNEIVVNDFNNDSASSIIDCVKSEDIYNDISKCIYADSNYKTTYAKLIDISSNSTGYFLKASTSCDSYYSNIIIISTDIDKESKCIIVKLNRHNEVYDIDIL